MDEWVQSPNGNGSAPSPTSGADPLPDMGQVTAWCEDLLNNKDDAFDPFYQRRGLSPDSIQNHVLGWDSRRQVYTIPVFDAEDDLITVRFYNMGASSGRKFWSIKGRGSAFLYPVGVLAEDPDTIIICEGELDALILQQAGYAAITRTGAAKVWNKAWNGKFKGKQVLLCHDCDDAGQAGNIVVGQSLARYADDIRVIRLPYPITKDHGNDVTDFWMERGGTSNRRAQREFRQLVQEAQPFNVDMLRPTEVDPTDAEAIDALDAELYGKPIRMELTVKGKARASYSLPRVVTFTCGRDAGPLCKKCPLNESAGEGLVEIERHDPVLLRMINSKTEDVDKMLLGIAGIPMKCPKVTMAKTFQAVETLFARPSVENSNGSRADFTMLKITSVGRHDTPSNCTVQVTGALHGNPRTQENEFQAWDVVQTRALEQRPTVDGKLYKLLSTFQHEGDPLIRLREVADDLSAHVTHIFGRPLLHAAMDLVWHSPLQFYFNGALLQRGWLELLVVGDTRTGKSEVATRLMEHYRAGESVNCEAASFAGVVGGAQQIRNEWMLTWGAIPINDRRLVVLDEVSGLSVEEIGQMSSIRSSGVAAIEKVVQDRTPARTRLIWLGNPRDDITMANYTYGVYAIRPLIGRAEDIARFDMAMSLRADDIELDKVLRQRSKGRLKFSQEACAALVRWVWTRTPEEVIWTPGAEDLIIKKSIELGNSYNPDPPLILKADMRIKLARIAVAIAARLFSTETGEEIIVTKAHVRAAAKFVDTLYSQSSFGYKQLSELDKADQAFASDQRGDVATFIDSNPELWRFFRLLPEGRFYSRDLEEVLNLSREAANGIVNRLITSRMARKDRGGIMLTPEMQKLVKDSGR